MARIRIVFCILAVITCMVWLGVYAYHSRRNAVILKSWNNLQLQVIKAAARSAEEWFRIRIYEQGFDKDEAEQEVFKKYIEPLQLLKNGAAWIYNREYVIYDKKNKTYGARYSSFAKAEKHAKDWNKIWRRGASERARLGIK